MNIKRFCSLAICLFLLVATLPTSVFATEGGITVEDALASGDFVPMSQEDYAYYANILENGTAQEKAAAVNEIFSISEYGVSTQSWNPSYTTDMGDGTYLVQGFVKCSHTQNNMTVNTAVSASARGTNSSGYTWTRVGTGSVSAASGSYSFINGNVDAQILNSTKIYLGITGTFEISSTNASNIGVNLGVMTLSHTTSGTKYYRQSFTGSYTQQAPVHAG